MTPITLYEHDGYSEIRCVAAGRFEERAWCALHDHEWGYCELEAGDMYPWTPEDCRPEPRLVQKGGDLK